MAHVRFESDEQARFLQAEFVGILLGDGGITEPGYQIVVSLNAATEIAYSRFVANLVVGLFGITSDVMVIPSDGACYVILSSVAAVEYVESIGMCRGNKVHNQVSVPGWILADAEFSRACLRGLMDTDGCVYAEAKNLRGKEYRYINLCFRSHSTPLLDDVHRMLAGLGFRPTSSPRQIHSLFLRRQADVERYCREVGTHNDYHLERYREFCAWRQTG